MQRIHGTRRALTDTFALVRVLPQVKRRHVGPFVFLDHFGPAHIGPEGMDVRPHPHIGLGTVTVLYEGQIRHRDSLGSDQWIRPGEVNWMVAGRGITHSERSEHYVGPVHGLQFWVALPDALQDVAPSFHHAPAGDIPRRQGSGTLEEVYIGTWEDMTSPVSTHGPTLLVLVSMDDGAQLALPAPPAGQELGVLVTAGGVDSDEGPLALNELGIVEGPMQLRAQGATTLAVLGGEAVGPRHMAWNFVHSDAARVEEAKERWRAGGFPTVPGDDTEFIPLP